MTEEMVFIPFKKSLYDDLVRFSDGKADPAYLATQQIENWIDLNFSMPPNVFSDYFEQLFRDRLFEFAEEYAPHWAEQMAKRGDALIEELLESRTPLAWKEITVPAGSEVRMIYRGRHFYGKVWNGQIVDDDGEFSPSSWVFKNTHTSRNAWRDLWFKSPGSTEWVPAEMLRQRARKALHEGGRSDA